MLFKFLYQNLKGYRFLVVFAILVTITQVWSDILTAFPLKFIVSKINNPGSDPACTFPLLDQYHILDIFDTPIFDPTFRDPVTHKVIPPPTSQCPVSQTDLYAAAHPLLTHHSVNMILRYTAMKQKSKHRRG